MYIDPNTGGMLFQVLATLLAVFSGVALLFSGKIRGFFARLRRSARGAEPEQPAASPDVEPAVDETEPDGHT